MTYRPEYERSWSTPENYRPIAVKPLNVAHPEVMLRAVLDAEQIPESLAPRVHQRTGGNALFNEDGALPHGRRRGYRKRGQRRNRQLPGIADGAGIDIAIEY